MKRLGRWRWQGGEKMRGGDGRREKGEGEGEAGRRGKGR